MRYRVGIVKEIDELKALCRVIFDDADMCESYWLPVVHHKTHKDKAYWMPDIGEHVACILDEKEEEGCIIGAIYSDRDTPPANIDILKCMVRYEDDSTICYDKSTASLIAWIKNIVSIKAGEMIILEAPLIVLRGRVINE